ncbi:MAG: phosphatidate cytidylyltransferase [Deltaproteobacteria bacterium]|nr:phosphatidate cytidylyltransferase [Deltaproteobacteria bacterium]
MKRIVPGLFIACFWLLLLLKGSTLLFSVVVAVIALVGCDEYLRMIDDKGRNYRQRWFVGLILATPVIGISIFPQISLLAFFIITPFFVLSACFIYKYQVIEDIFVKFSQLVFGLIYVGLCGAYLVLLRHLPDGGSWLIIAAAITACSDSGAYFVGRAIGKHKLSPHISPNKTIEGAIGGIFAGVLGAMFFASLLMPGINWFFLVLSAILISSVGIAGDLTESIIKRGTGTKDSGSILAGHGGILDRVDSLLFAAPVLYYLIVFMGM